CPCLISPCPRLSSFSPSLSLLFFFLLRPPPTSPLFPYTTLFRSCVCCHVVASSRSRPWRTAACPPVSWPVMRLGDYAVEAARGRSEEHTSELQSLTNLVCRLLLEKKKKIKLRLDCTTACLSLVYV